MQVEACTDIAATADPAPRSRVLLIAGTILAMGAGGVVLATGDASAHDPDFLRLMRFMAAIKGVFAFAVLAGCLWRLARPAGPWRRLAYVAGPPLMIVGACGLWAMRDPGLAALALHAGLFGVLAAALTDPDFVPDSLLRRRRPGSLASRGRRM